MEDFSTVLIFFGSSSIATTASRPVPAALRAPPAPAPPPDFDCDCDVDPAEDDAAAAAAALALALAAASNVILLVTLCGG